MSASQDNPSLALGNASPAPQHCPCGAELTSIAALAHGVCDGCRVEAKRRRRPQRQATSDDQPGLFDAEPTARRLVPLDDWPDYHAQGLI